MTTESGSRSYAFDVTAEGVFSNRRTFAFGESFSVESLIRPLIRAYVSSRSRFGKSLDVASEHIIHLADAVLSRSFPMASIPIPRVTFVSGSLLTASVATSADCMSLCRRRYISPLILCYEGSKTDIFSLGRRRRRRSSL